MNTNWPAQFMQELNRELSSRCNHGVTVFFHGNSEDVNIPHYSVTVRGKTIWLEMVLWDDRKPKPTFRQEFLSTIDKLWTAFYVHIVIKDQKLQGVWVGRHEERPAFLESLGEAVRQVTAMFDLDTTDLDY